MLNDNKIDFEIMIKTINDLCLKNGVSVNQAVIQSGAGKSFVDNLKKGCEPSTKKVSLLADFFGVTTDYLMGKSQPLKNMVSFVPGPVKPVVVIGEVKAGYNGIAYTEELGFESAEVENPEEYRYFKVKGDSMSPLLIDGDYALIRLQSDIESGDIAVVIYNGEIGTIKKIIKKDDAIILHPINPNYETKIYTGKEMEDVHIYGRLMEIKRKF